MVMAVMMGPKAVPDAACSRRNKALCWRTKYQAERHTAQN